MILGFFAVIGVHSLVVLQQSMAAFAFSSTPHLRRCVRFCFDHIDSVCGLDDEHDGLGDALAIKPCLFLVFLSIISAWLILFTKKRFGFL